MGNDSDNLMKELIEVIIKAATTPAPVSKPASKPVSKPDSNPVSNLDPKPDPKPASKSASKSASKPTIISFPDHKPSSDINEPFIYNSNTIKLIIEEVDDYTTEIPEEFKQEIIKSDKLIIEEVGDPATDIQEEFSKEVNARSTVVHNRNSRRIVKLKDGKLCIKK